MLLDERVRDRLATGTRFKVIEHLPSVDSTNRLVADRALAGAPEGLVVSTDLQTAGRGRLDRTWESEAGSSLLVSLLLRPSGLPPQRWHLITAATGLAAVESCEKVVGFAPELKWPNDLLAGGRKLAGILAEVAGEAVVVGMGLNVHGAPPGAAWLDDAAGKRAGRAELLETWLWGIDARLGNWDAVAAEYRARCSTIGREVAVELGSETVEGVAESVDDEGRLVLRTTTDSERVFSAGDVTHLRPAGGDW